MQMYEYRVVPAPRKGEKVKGARTTADRFAHALAQVMNAQAADGWEYLRADTLPVEERVGLTGRTTTFQHMLVFRRVRAVAPAQDMTAPAAAPQPRFDDETEPDPLDIAARRAAMVARPVFGTAPRVAASADTGLAPPVGPAGRDTPAAE